jgi:hypothetical protein
MFISPGKASAELTPPAPVATPRELDRRKRDADLSALDRVHAAPVTRRSLALWWPAKLELTFSITDRFLAGFK